MSYKATQPEVPFWRKYQVAFGALSAAGVTNDIEIMSLPARGVIHGVQIIVTTPFSGGTVATMTLSVGIATNLVKYCTAINAFTGSTLQQPQMLGGIESASVTTSIRLSAISTVGLLNALSAGAADIEIFWAILP